MLRGASFIDMEDLAWNWYLDMDGTLMGAAYKVE